MKSHGKRAIAEEAYDAAGGDPLLALLLVLDLIRAGRIRVGVGRPASIVTNERAAA